ncbi:hypothetical protein [Terrarubrum flagellatum]|uniref:hypothetical protein n=1 Tax=Terrirubrum flagellatum TaxID=2895980 RepID=UPI003144E329
MRVVLSMILALTLSLFTGGMAAVQIAEIVRAREEFILAFLMLIIVATIAALIFGVARFRADAPRAVRNAGYILLAILIVAIAALLVAFFYASGEIKLTSYDGQLITELAIPGLVAILTQWAFVRWRVLRHLAA